MTDPPIAAARDGDAQAWRSLIDDHAGLVWSIIRGFRFDEDTSCDVFQTVWLKLAEHLDRIREPAKLASWLGQTARNECVGVVRQRSRTVVSEEVIDLTATDDSSVSDGLERDEERFAVAMAFHRLPERCQKLLRLLVVDPPTSYEEISRQLGVPIGSIGPTRARCLESLRSTPEIFRITKGVRSS